MNEPCDDPPVREDGRCAYCLQPRGAMNVRPLYRAAALSDPFCSTECARAYHHAPKSPLQGRPAKRSYV